MKKKLLLSATLLGVGALTLMGCSNHVQTVTGSAQTVSDSLCWNEDDGYWKFSYGHRYVKTDMTVTSGKITDLTFHEVFSPTAWARIDEEDLASYNEGDYLTLNNYFNLEGERDTVYFAKYIRIGEYTFEGRIRSAATTGDTTYMAQGEPIAWKWVDIDASVADSSTYPYDLAQYLPLESGYTYLLRRRLLWYFDCIDNEEVKIIQKYDAETKGGTEVAPNYPSDTPYRDVADETFATGLDAIETFIKGLGTIAYKDTTYNSTTKLNVASLQVVDGVWNYNAQYCKDVLDESAWTPITGLTTSYFATGPTGLAQLQRYFTSANICFASVEFASLI